ncbi:MAG: hypothetical protein WBC70_09200 [Candidatus Aminicenantales bacterium]
MRIKSVFLIIALMLMFNCKKGEDEALFKTELIDGIQHVYNMGKPIKGEISLEVSEILRIDPFDIDRENPPFFETAVKDEMGNLYLADNQNVRVYKFDSGGKPVARFLRKGQGPGEFPMFGDLQVADDHVWVIGTWPLKIAKFTRDGEFINEWMFRTFRNFYLQTKVIEEDRFLTVSYRDMGEEEKRVRVSTLMNPSEEFLNEFYEDGNAGILRIRTGLEEGPAIASTNPLIAADIHHAYDRDSGTVYACNNREYEIQAKNPDGTTRMVIHKAHEEIVLDEATKDSILRLIAPRIPPEAKPSVKEQLPPTLNAIWGMAVIPSGHLAVRRITGLESVEIDLFDREGRLLYTVLPSTEIPDLRDVIMFENTVGVISELEEKNIYVEYRVRNLKEIFD